MVVSVESVSTIVPAVPTPQPCTLWLCNFQIQVLAENYLKQVYYYPAALDHVSSFDSLVASLKDSLSRILVPYYPLAGRPRIAGLDRPILECNDRGIEFVVAFADASFGDWGDSMKQCSIEQEISPAQTAITDPENFPQLKVQVTSYSSRHHTLLDGSSVFPFLKAWSELHRGFPPPNPPPSFDSSLLKARDPPCVTVPVRDFVALIPAIAEEMGKAAQDFKPSYHVRAFHMNEQQLAELKHDLRQQPDLLRGRLGSRLEKPWQPPMPSEYTHEDVRNVGQERIQSTIDWMEETLRKGHDIGLNVPPPSTGMGIYSVNLHSFPVYHGSSTIEKWAGRPHPNSNSYGNGVVVLLPTPQGGMREHRIVVMLLEEQMKRLLQSELFARFTTLDC
ncbi:hypothetical protein SELMODRAFT_405840 [Selaginella moellendorffii]|uniref:BAHD family acyltransferase n=1 Tax=Selaginella moellendorffii TaxID=88036 RepID=D8QZV2_SELML|nr:hypothetical protein SELMODRAFT_405840 [Selaginella moellendorffii]